MEKWTSPAETKSAVRKQQGRTRRKETETRSSTGKNIVRGLDAVDMATEAPPNPNDGWVARLQDLHNKAVAAYIEANPASQQRHEEALEHMPGGNTRSVLHQDPFPLAFQSGQGCFVTSLDGDEYLDFVSEYSAALFGHSNPVIQKAMHDALDNGMNLGGPGRDEVELARLIKARFPKIKKLRFCNSGTEANTMALALATNITKRRKVGLLILRNCNLLTR